MATGPEDNGVGRPEKAVAVDRLKIRSLEEAVFEEPRWCDACGAGQPLGCAWLVRIGWSRAELCEECFALLKSELA